MPSFIEEIFKGLFVESFKGTILTLGLVFIFLTRQSWNQFIASIIKIKRNNKGWVVDVAQPQSVEPKREVKTEGKTDGAVVSYKVASVLPEINTISFDFLKDWKVWFLIKNHERKKYKAYIKIRFVSSDGSEEEVKEGYYGGDKAWNLNVLATIIAPGLSIPEKIKEKARQRKRIEIRISCEIKDENDELIERKLPVGYVYDYANNNWYYEP